MCPGALSRFSFMILYSSVCHPSANKSGQPKALIDLVCVYLLDLRVCLSMRVCRIVRDTRGCVLHLLLAFLLHFRSIKRFFVYSLNHVASHMLTLDAFWAAFMLLQLVIGVLMDIFTAVESSENDVIPGCEQLSVKVFKRLTRRWCVFVHAIVHSMVTVSLLTKR